MHYAAVVGRARISDLCSLAPQWRKWASQYKMCTLPAAVILKAYRQRYREAVLQDIRFDRDLALHPVHIRTSKTAQRRSSHR